ncbi:MAG: hypothetical protein ABMA26_24750 [Limisphaerales bacterium]
MQPGNRKFYLLVAVFLFCAVLVGVISAGRSTSSVDKWKAEMRAKGEKFTIAELIPKRTGPVTNRTAELVRLGQSLAGQSASLGTIEHFRYLSNGLAEAAWMQPGLWGKRFSPPTASPSPASKLHATPGRPPGAGFGVFLYDWEELAAEISATGPVLADLHALLRLPDRNLGWNYDPKTPMPRCFVEKRAIAQWLAAANTYHLHAREPDRAFANMAAMFDLTAWHAEDYTLVGQMIRVAIGGMALHSTWATMQSPGLTDAQLATLQVQLQGNSVLPQLARTFEVERASLDQVFVSVRTGQESIMSALGGGSPTGWGHAGEQMSGVAWRLFLSDADELFYLRNMQGHVDVLRKVLRLRDWSAVQAELASNRAELAVFDTWRGNLLFLSRIAIPNLIKAMQTAARYETRRELTLTAVVLERHRRRHGRHPDSLDKLVPEFLSAAPADWMDGKPLRYRLNPDGSYTLWSVNEDFKDDGGDATDASATSRQRDIWDGRDAVWPRVLKQP